MTKPASGSKLYGYLQALAEPNKSACLALWRDNKERFEAAPGSLSKHQTWSGGYIDHVEETMDFAADLFRSMSARRPLGFSLADVVLVLFLHDLEKPFRYVDPKAEFASDDEKKVFIDGIVEKYGIVLSDDHKNALRYIHGEGTDYSRTERLQGPLAAFAHICDVASARIWFDFPL